MESRDNGFVYGGGELFLAHDHAAARAAKCFMRCCGDNIEEGNGICKYTARDQSGDVRKICHGYGANLFGNLVYTGVVNLARES